MTASIYEDGKYLQENRSWHAEDSPWKAEQISEMIRRNGLHPRSIVELGCGAGGILRSLYEMDHFSEVRFSGYDISPQAFELASAKASDRLNFYNEDLLAKDTQKFDLLLLIDVFEHVEDYVGFLRLCRDRAEYKIFHIPLDLHVSSVLRNTFVRTRYSLGHLHYFTADSSLAVLRDAGYDVLDARYTDPAFGLFRLHPSMKKALANVPRWLVSRISVSFAARMFGGYSLLVLAK